LNYGGDMVLDVIEHYIENNDLEKEDVPVKLVSATRGKALRAQPASLLYQQGRVHHIGKFDKLEDEMCLWSEGDASPNRLDALVWAITALKEKVKNMPKKGRSWNG